MHKYFKGDVNKLPERNYDPNGEQFDCDIFAGGEEAPLTVLASAGERVNADYYNAVMVGVEKKSVAPKAENKSLTPKLENK